MWADARLGDENPKRQDFRTAGSQGLWLASQYARYPTCFGDSDIYEWE
jgi:hypothetical protein